MEKETMFSKVKELAQFYTVNFDRLDMECKMILKNVRKTLEDELFMPVRNVIKDEVELFYNN